MNALGLLDAYALAYPGHVRVLGPVSMDFDHRLAIAVEITSPTGRVYRRGMRWSTNLFDPRVAPAVVIRPYRRKLKRWLRT